MRIVTNADSQPPQDVLFNRIWLDLIDKTNYQTTT